MFIHPWIVPKDEEEMPALRRANHSSGYSKLIMSLETPLSHMIGLLPLEINAHDVEMPYSISHDPVSAVRSPNAALSKVCQCSDMRLAGTQNDDHACASHALASRQTSLRMGLLDRSSALQRTSLADIKFNDYLVLEPRPVVSL